MKVGKIDNAMETVEKKRTAHFVESYGVLGGDDRRFDCHFWQPQGPKAVFDAAYELICDYLLIKKGYADKPRLQRTVESFQKKSL